MLQRRLISVFHYALRPNGFLMLGPAETAGGTPSFSLIDKKWRFYRKTPGDTNFALALPAGRLGEGHPGTPTARGAVAHPVIRPVQDDANRVILERYAPPAVVVDANFQIVQFRGRTGPYLEAASGEPNLSILKMARSGLLHPLRAALQSARRRHRSVRKESVQVQRNGDWHAIDFEVVPIPSARGEHFLVLFETPALSSRGAKKGKGRAQPERQERRRGDRGRIGDLRRELAASRDYLQSMIQELEAANEELQSANEEILSSNEELQSTNEELDTAKEELQSTNEELNTVNEELHSRNDELARVNSDLVNLLGSVDFPIVIVGDDLTIRRFTPMAEQVFNVLPTDVSRPIGQLKPNILADDLTELIRDTIENVAPREREVQDRQGRWYSLRIRPYKGIDNRLEGAVVAAVDIDAAKRRQTEIQEVGNQVRAVIEAVRLPLVVLDADLRVRMANQGFLGLMRTTGATIEGVPIYELRNGQWGSSNLREALERLATARADNPSSVGESLSMDGARRMKVNARRLKSDDTRCWILVSFERPRDAEINP